MKFSRVILIALILSLLVISFSFAAKDTVVVAMMQEPSKLDPIVYQDTVTSIVLSQITDPLIELTTDGNYTTEDSVLESFSISPDAKVYTFKVKKGITFHNGEPLTAEDIKFTYEAFKNPELGSPHRKYYEDIEKIELVDEYTLKVYLKKPNVVFLATARLRGHVLPKDYIEQVGWDGYQQHPIGSGPYKFVRYIKGQEIVLTANENYWGKKPKIKNLIFKFYPESASVVMALQTKEVDYVIGLPAEDFKMLRETASDILKFGTYAEFADHRIAFNKRPDCIFHDVRLRKAIAHAINIDELIAVSRGDMAIKAIGRIPNFHAAFSPDVPTFEYNPEKAKELMKEAGYPNGFKTKVYVASSAQEAILEAQVMQQQLKKVGIDLEIVTLEWGIYLDVTAEGEAPMFIENWHASLPSPYSFIEIWHSQSGWNPIFGTYHNPKVDELIDKIKVTVDPEERWKLYREVQKIALSDVVCIPLYWPIVGIAYNNELNIPEELFNAFKIPHYHINEWSF